MVLGIRGIEESSVYQAILKKGIAEGFARGRVEGVRQALIRLGSKKFGPPPEQAIAQIKGVKGLNRLWALIDRLLDVATWDELLGPSD